MATRLIKRLRQTLAIRRDLLMPEKTKTQNLRFHQNQVARVAYSLARALEKKGVPLKPREFLVSGMLHDSLVLKGKALAWEKAQERKELAVVLKQARVTAPKKVVLGTNAFDLFAGKKPEDPRKLSWKTKILLLADNHVANDTIVPLSDRRDYHFEKFPSVKGRTVKDVDQVFDALEGIERELIHQGIDVYGLLKKLAARYPSRTKTAGFVKH